MKVLHCIECNEYKYIERNGKCKDCIRDEKINIGNKNRNDIRIDKNKIYHNVSIMGMVGSGKTTLMNHLINESTDANSGLYYFDYLSIANPCDFESNNIYKVKIGKNKKINLFKTVRKRGDLNYIKEVNMTAEFITDIIRNQLGNKIDSTSLTILESILKIVIDSEDMYLFEDVYNIMTDKSFRESCIRETHRRFSIDKSIGDDINTSVIDKIYSLSNRLDDTVIKNSNNSLDVRNIVSNSEKIIFDLGDIFNSPDMRTEISILLIKKLFNEICLQDKTHYLFCIDGINYSTSQYLEKEYRHSRHYKISFMSTFQIPSNVSSMLLNNSGIIISFRLSYDDYMMSNILDVNSKDLANLPLYNYIFHSMQDTVYPLEVDM